VSFSLDFLERGTFTEYPSLLVQDACLFIGVSYIVLIFIIFVLSLIIAQQNEDIDTLKYIDDNQYNTKIDEYPDKRQAERKYHFIQFHHR